MDIKQAAYKMVAAQRLPREILQDIRSVFVISNLYYEIRSMNSANLCELHEKVDSENWT